MSLWWEACGGVDLDVWHYDRAGLTSALVIIVMYTQVKVYLLAKKLKYIQTICIIIYK